MCLPAQCQALCNPMDCSLPASSVHGIILARILAWVTMPSSMGSSASRDQTCISSSPALASRFFTAEPSRKPKRLVYALLTREIVD